MLRFLSSAAVLLAIASTSAAAGRYVEVWNPPEARLVKPAPKCKPKTGKTALLSHGSARVAPRRVAEALSKNAVSTSATPARHVVGEPGRKSASQRFIDIPRILTPEGNVLRVKNGGAPVYVVR